MSRHPLLTLAAATLLAGAALPAAAGELAAEGQGGYFQLAAKNTASAVYNSTSAPIFGGGLRYTFWRGAFVSAALRSFSRDGQLVFVSAPNAPVQRGLGFPLSMTTRSILLSAGYRIRNGRLVVPYLLAGAAITKYDVTAPVLGDTSYDEHLSKTGFSSAAGVEVGRGLLRVGAEVGYTTVPNAIGKDGVSKVYNENNIGGLHVIGKIALAFGL